jgi:hypothetical protein
VGLRPPAMGDQPFIRASTYCGDQALLLSGTFCSAPGVPPKDGPRSRPAVAAGVPEWREVRPYDATGVETVHYEIACLSARLRHQRSARYRRRAGDLAEREPSRRSSSTRASRAGLSPLPRFGQL